MSCTCPRCDQGGGECLYDQIERLKSTITRQSAALEMAVEALERILAFPKSWTREDTAALAACRDALKGEKL